MNEENLDKIFMEGYSDGYTQCLVNIEGGIKKLWDDRRKRSSTNNKKNLKKQETNI